MSNLDTLYNQITSLEAIALDIQRFGIDRNQVTSLEQQGIAIVNKVALESFTNSPSSTNKQIAIESVLSKISDTIKAIIDAIIAFIQKVFNWVFGSKDSPTGVAAKIEKDAEVYQDGLKTLDDDVTRFLDDGKLVKVNIVSSNLLALAKTGNDRLLKIVLKHTPESINLKMDYVSNMIASLENGVMPYITPELDKQLDLLLSVADKHTLFPAEGNTQAESDLAKFQNYVKQCALIIDEFATGLKTGSPDGKDVMHSYTPEEIKTIVRVIHTVELDVDALKKTFAVLDRDFEAYSKRLGKLARSKGIPAPKKIMLKSMKQCLNSLKSEIDLYYIVFSSCVKFMNTIRQLNEQTKG